MGSEWEETWVNNLNDYYGTQHDDMNDFTSAQFGEVHYDLYGAKEGRDLFYKDGNDDDDGGDDGGGGGNVNQENNSNIQINNEITQSNQQEANAYNEFGDITNVGNNNTVEGYGTFIINNQQTAGNNTATNTSTQNASIENNVNVEQSNNNGSGVAATTFADDIYKKYGVVLSFV